MDENGVGAAGDGDAAVRVVGAVCAPGVVYAVSVGGVAGVAGVVSFLSFADGGGVAWVSAVGGGCAFGVVSFVGVCGVWVGWVDQDGVEEDAVEQFLQAVRGAVVEAGAVAEQVKEVGHALVEGAAVGVCLGQQAGLACPAGQDGFEAVAVQAFALAAPVGVQHGLGLLPEGLGPLVRPIGDRRRLQ